MAKDLGLAASALSSKPEKKAAPKKSIKRISHEAAHSGGYVIKHEHHSPVHPDETHLAPDKDALMAHMDANQPMPAPGAAPEPAGEPEPGAQPAA